MQTELLPRPQLGMTVEVDGDPHYYIAAVDFIRRTYDVHPFKEARNGKIRCNLSLDNEYHPVANRENFARALDEWDYDYRMSDDPKLYDLGRTQEQALADMFNRLSLRDKSFYRKVVAIITAACTKSVSR